MPSLSDLSRSGALVLTDGGIETRMIFEKRQTLDPVLEVAALILEPSRRGVLESIYLDYLRVGRAHGLPVIIGTPTFRASPARAGRDVAAMNAAAVEMHRGLIREVPGVEAFVAGVLGPRRDAYRPDEAMPTDEASVYHAVQARALADAGADFLFAPTFPALDESLGACRAMADCGVPYVISFVIDGDGRLLDGTRLVEAMTRIDAAVDPAPLHYSISCVHPSVVMRALDGKPHDRLREVKANASPLPPQALDGIAHVEADAPDVFADAMWALHERCGISILGGCCGTDDRHMAALAARMTA